MMAVKAAAVLLVVFCLVILGINANSSTAKTSLATTYYVSNAGSDGNNGLTPETAWQTIDHVNNRTFEPGDSILFRRGDTWRESLIVSSSGISNGWITYGAYGSGDKPRILGSEQATGWTEVSHNIWRSNTDLDNPYQGGYSYGEVYFEEPDGTYKWGEHQDYDASYSQMMKEYDWSWNNNRVYIYAPSAPSLRYAAVEVPQRDYCVRMPNVPYEEMAEYIAIDNLEIMYALRQGIWTAYNEVEAHGLRITNNHIGMIGVKGGSSAYCIASWYSDTLIQNNTIHDCGRRGVSLNTYTDHTPGLAISNVTIDNNHFYNGFHTTSVDISTLPGLGHTFTNFTISNNLIDDTGRWGDGIHDGCYASSCTSNSLYIQSNGSNYSNFYIYNNVIVGSTSRAILVRDDVEGLHVYHNTVYANHPEARPYALVIFYNVSGVDLRNNIVYGTLDYDEGANDARCVQDEGATSFLVRDYNLYHQEDPDQPITGSENGVGGWDVFLYEWDIWRADSGFEIHSPYPQKPLFVDQENGDFRLQADSPAIDAGVLIPGFNDNYNGAAPDLGAIEFEPSLRLHGTPADRAIDLTWDVNTSLSPETTWQIDYYTSTMNILTVTDPNSATRSYTLTGLTNYELYTVTLSAMVDTTAIYSDTVAVMPTDILVYVPLILR